MSVVTWKNQKGYIEGYERINGVRVRFKLHRRLMEQYLCRKLEPWEDVHHINGNKADNRLENLEVISHARHTVATNTSRTYPTGYEMRLTDAERQARSHRAKAQNLGESGRKRIKTMQEEIDRLRLINAEMLEALMHSLIYVQEVKGILAERDIVSWAGNPEEIIKAAIRKAKGEL